MHLAKAEIFSEKQINQSKSSSRNLSSKIKKNQYAESNDKFTYRTSVDSRSRNMSESKYGFNTDNTKAQSYQNCGGSTAIGKWG